MTFKLFCSAATSVLLAGLLISCGGENHIESGISIQVGETHSETLPGDDYATPSLLPNNASVNGGYDSLSLEKHPLRDITGRVVSLYSAYVVIDEVQLRPCSSLAEGAARMLRGVAGLIVPAAYAHAGHGSEPLGGRALDKPNVINIVTQEGFILPLGELPLAPGSYCGINLSMRPLWRDAYGLAEAEEASTDNPISNPGVPDMTGRMLYLQSDYCAELNDANECIYRVRVDIDDGGLPEPTTITINFASPLQLDAERRQGFAIVGIAYGQWLHNVDITRLSGNATELNKLLNNIASSFYAYETGLGGLPANVLSD